MKGFPIAFSSRTASNTSARKRKVCQKDVHTVVTSITMEVVEVSLFEQQGRQRAHKETGNSGGLVGQKNWVLLKFEFELMVQMLSVAVMVVAK